MRGDVKNLRELRLVGICVEYDTNHDYLPLSISISTVYMNKYTTSERTLYLI